MASYKCDNAGFINKWHRYLSTFRSIKPGQVIRVSDPAPDLWTVAIHNHHEIYKENKTMPTNEEIVKAAKESKEKYQEWLKGGVEVGIQDDCAMCVLFNDCDKCIFPTCYDADTSYNLLFNHWLSDHQDYVGGDYPQCVSKCCEPFGKAVIKDLDDIIEKYSEVEKFYSIGDRFECGRCDYILGYTGKSSCVTLVNLESGYSCNNNLIVKDVNKITVDELNKLKGIFSLTHISGPTYKEPENLCKFGFEFGKDYKNCGIDTPCNQKDRIFIGDKGVEEALWYKCWKKSEQKGCK